MEAVLDLLSWIFIVGGLFFMIVGTIGILRMPDVLSRLHPAGMTDTMGAGLLILGMCLQTTDWMVLVRLLFVYGFLLFTAPIASHALARAVVTASRRADTAGEGTGAS
ncbi:MAG: monovalent cation/H(+) antiporter subunit G [Gemmatimonadota bacterium]|nr:monovalent cation/H(+) antiporter subunit G [Gemmatimonadota bacterium]